MQKLYIAVGLHCDLPVLYGSGEYDQCSGFTELLECIDELIQFIGGVEQPFNYSAK